jgi:hypothetical protein
VPVKLIVAFCTIFALTPGVIVSVAPTLVDSAKLVTFWEVDLIFMILPDAIALTPIACRLVSAVIAAARFEAIMGSVFPD